MMWGFPGGPHTQAMLSPQSLGLASVSMVTWLAVFVVVVVFD